MRIMGLDVSSTTIGWAILDVNDDKINFIKCDFYKPSKKTDLFQTLSDTRTHINSIIKKYEPNYIAIEDIIQFMQGASGAKTIIKLSVFNRMVGLLAFDYLGESPKLFNVMSIRHGLKLSKDLPKKEDMPELIAKRLNIKFPYVYNKKNEIATESEDMADGVAVALYCAYTMIGLIKVKTKKKKARKK